MRECDLDNDDGDSRTLRCVVKSADHDLTGAERDVNGRKRSMCNGMSHVGDDARVSVQNGPTV